MTPDVGFDTSLRFSGARSPSATLSKLRIRQPRWCENGFQGRVWCSHRVRERRDFRPTQLAHLISSLLRPPTQVAHEPRTCRTFPARACDGAAPHPQRPPRLLPLSSPPSRRPVIAWLSPPAAVGLTHFLHRWARLEDPAPQRAGACTQTPHQGVHERTLGCCYQWPCW